MTEARETKTGATDHGFPGKTVAGVCEILAPPLLVVGALLQVGIYHAMGDDFVRGMAEHHTRAEVALNVAVVGLVLLTFAVFAVARQIAALRPGIGQAGGVLAIIGLFGPVFFNGVYFGGFQLTDAATQGVAATMMDQAQMVPSHIINISGPALVVGFILLAIGAARTGVLDRQSSWALGATCLIPVGFISGYIIISALGFLGTAYALVPLGFRTLRSSSVPLDS